MIAEPQFAIDFIPMTGVLPWLKTDEDNFKASQIYQMRDIELPALVGELPGDYTREMADGLLIFRQFNYEASVDKVTGAMTVSYGAEKVTRSFGPDLNVMNSNPMRPKNVVLPMESFNGYVASVRERFESLAKTASVVFSNMPVYVTSAIKYVVRTSVLAKEALDRYRHGEESIDEFGELSQYYKPNNDETRNLNESPLSMDETEKMITIVSLGILMSRLIKREIVEFRLVDAVFKYALGVINSLDDMSLRSMGAVRLFHGFEDTSSVFYCDWTRVRNSWIDVQTLHDAMKRMCSTSSFGISTNHILSYQNLFVQIALPHGPFRLFDLLLTYTSILNTLSYGQRSEQADNIARRTMSFLNDRNSDAQSFSFYVYTLASRLTGKSITKSPLDFSDIAPAVRNIIEVLYSNRAMRCKDQAIMNKVYSMMVALILHHVVRTGSHMSFEPEGYLFHLMKPIARQAATLKMYHSLGVTVSPELLSFSSIYSLNLIGFCVEEMDSNFAPSRHVLIDLASVPHHGHPSCPNPDYSFPNYLHNVEHGRLMESFNDIRNTISSFFAGVVFLERHVDPDSATFKYHDIRTSAVDPHLGSEEQPRIVNDMIALDLTDYRQGLEDKENEDNSQCESSDDDDEDAFARLERGERDGISRDMLAKFIKLKSRKRPRSYAGSIASASSMDTCSVASEGLPETAGIEMAPIDFNFGDDFIEDEIMKLNYESKPE